MGGNQVVQGRALSRGWCSAAQEQDHFSPQGFCCAVMAMNLCETTQETAEGDQSPMVQLE